MLTTKRLFLLLSFMLAFVGLNAEEVTFTVPDFSIEPGETKEISLVMTTSSDNMKFNFNGEIILDEGLSFVSEDIYDEDLEEDVTTYAFRTARLKNKHAIASNLKAANDLTFVVSAGTSFLAYNAGDAVITFKVKAAANMTAGTVSVKLKDMSAAGADKTELVKNTEYTATVTISKDCTITIGVNNENYGTATLSPDPGTGTVKSGTEFTATATPKTGYNFVKWSDGSTENPYTFTLADDLNLTAEFAVQTFDIIFQNEDGSEIQKQTQNYGTATIKPTNPTKEGYTFTGWDPAVDATVTSAKTYKATFSINKYKIKFVLDNGSADVENELDYGATITPPTNPTKEGYTFTGWNPAVDATVPATNKTYTAQYEVNKWTVSFRYLAADEETWQTVDKTNIAFGTVITTAMEPDRPTLPGMPFLNWKDADGNALVLGTTTVPDKNVVYTANYDVSKYTITYDVDGTITNVEVPYKAEITPITDPTKAGHDFAGWTWKKTADGSALSNMAGQKMPAYALTATATWNVHSFTIIFQNEDGSEIQNRTQNYGTTTITPTDPTKEGYTFTGWDPAVDATVTSAKTYKATFSVNKYKIKFVLGNGSADVESELDYGTTITPPTDPTKEGYTFTGWNPAVDATVPATDKTYTAQYQINKYTVKFLHPKDNSVIQQNLLDFGAAITAPAAPEWSGHTFLGWVLDSDMSTQVDVATTVPAGDLTYYAFFETTMYTITYKIEGQEDIVRQVGFEYPLPAEDPTPEVEGYNFKGWIWSTGAKPTTMPANNIIATADLEIKTNTVKFFEEDGTTQIGSDFTGVYNSDITAPTATTKTGYTFDGWTIIGGDDTVLATVTKIPGDNTNYQAHYTVNKHKITYKVDGEVYQEVPDVEYGTTLVAIDAPQDREGYTFSGWSEFASATMPDEDVIVTGTFNINQYTITFVTLDESGSVKETIQSTTQNYATAIVAPDETDSEIAAKLDRTGEGWIFRGWALESDPQTKVDVAATVPANDLTYVAYYVPNIVNVIYIVDGDTLTQVTVDYQAALPEDPAPEKEGHTFSGWTTWRNELATVTYEEKPATMPAENVVAEGSFTVNQYCVTFISDNAIVSEEWINYGAPIVAPTNPEKIGHDFTGWAPALPATVPARDLTFYAQFTPLTYTIIYMVDGEEYQRVNTPFGANITPLVVEKEGYTFSGWEDLPETMPARNVRATGSLTINQYQVTFMDNENIVKEEMLDFGAEIVAPEAPAHEGFNFVRWENLLETVPANDVVFTAVYEIIEDITPVEEEVKLDFAKDLLNEAGEPIALNNAVVKNTYYNFDPAKGDTYDTDEKCLVLSTSTTENQMAEVVEEAMGSSNMAQNFAGLVLSVKGEGTIEIDCQTFGNKELFVKVGDNEPKVFKKIERGLAEVAYNAAENTPVYIYASSSTGIETADDALKIWSVNIVPGSSTPVSIKALREAIEKGTCYTIDGRKLNDVPTKKGFYIINGKKVMIK